jgi:uncharacterized protein with HEPN domain
MSKGRELSDYLNDIITAIADTAEFTQGMTYEMFAADKKTVNAVIIPFRLHTLNNSPMESH